MSSNSDSKTPRKGLIQKRKDKLTEHYISKGYGPNAAKAMAEQRIKTEAVLAVVGTIAVTAVAIKVARRIGQDYVDQTFKSGKIIQNIGANPNANFKDTPFFAAVNRADKKVYGMNYADEKRAMVKRRVDQGDREYQGIFNNQIKLTGDVRRASVANAQKIFYEKMDSDPQFRKEVLDTLKKLVIPIVKQLENTYKKESMLENYTIDLTRHWLLHSSRRLEYIRSITMK